MEIVCSKHAVQRMRERFPTVREPEATIKREVAGAIEAHRRSKTRPLWASTYSVVKGSGSVRYVWPENMSRCYVVAGKRVNGKSGLMVVTTLPRGNPENIDRLALTRPDKNQTRTGKHAPRGERDPKYKPGTERFA